MSSETKRPTKWNEGAVLKKLRAICDRLPETTEKVTFGHPTFCVGGRTFAVLEEYKGELGIALKVEAELQSVFLKDSRFFRTPYIGKHGWVTLRVHAAPLDWREVGSLIKGSYQLVAFQNPPRSGTRRAR